MLLALWVGLTVLAAGVLRRRGARGLLVPLLTVVVWVAVLTAGDLLLGWTA